MSKKFIQIISGKIGARVDYLNGFMRCVKIIIISIFFFFFGGGGWGGGGGGQNLSKCYKGKWFSRCARHLHSDCFSQNLQQL